MTGTVLRVGAGRGFVIETNDARYVVTAAHCLPELPPAHPGSHLHERTYKDFFGALDGSRNVWAECVFVNPVADIAVFGEPDSQALSAQAEAYRDLTDNATPFALGRLRYRRSVYRLPDGTTVPGNGTATSKALMLSLEGEWFSCRIVSIGVGRSLWISNAAQPIRGGMSGSPIILPDGSAVGVMCVSMAPEGTEHREGGPNPVLTAALPAWLAREAQR